MTTGVSAADRVTTGQGRREPRRAIGACAIRPLFPLRAVPAAFWNGAAIPKATVDLMCPWRACRPAVCCAKLTNDERHHGASAAGGGLCRANDLPLLACRDIVRWRERQEGRA